MRPFRLIAVLGVVTASLGLSTASRAQESDSPGIRVAPVIRWPVRAPFGTTVRCPFSYVPDGDTVTCWGAGAVELVMLEGPKCTGYCGAFRYYHTYYYRGYSRRGGCYASVTRRAFLRDV